MELSPFEIYLVMQADSIKGVIIAILMIGVVVSTISVVVWFVDEDKRPVHANMIRKFAPWVAVIMSLATVFPSTKTLVAMYSVPVVLQALQSEQVSETTNKALQSVNKLLDTYLSEVEQ